MESILDRGQVEYEIEKNIVIHCGKGNKNAKGTS